MGPGIEFKRYEDIETQVKSPNPSDTSNASNALNLCGTEYMTRSTNTVYEIIWIIGFLLFEYILGISVIIS